jgi:hypothetical protein
LSATISESPPIVTFSDVVEIPSRHELEAVLSSISAINSKLKILDRNVSLSKSYVSKCATKPSQGRLSPVDGESDIRWKFRDAEQGKRGHRATGKGTSFEGAGAKFTTVPFDDDEMED